MGHNHHGLGETGNGVKAIKKNKVPKPFPKKVILRGELQRRN